MKRLGYLLVLVSFAAGCASQPAPQPTVAPPTPAPTWTAQPTYTPRPTYTPFPTWTAMPTATFTPLPTSTSTPVATLTALPAQVIISTTSSDDPPIGLIALGAGLALLLIVTLRRMLHRAD